MGSKSTRRRIKYENSYSQLPGPLDQTEYLFDYYGVDIDTIKKEIARIERIGWKEMRFEFKEIPASTPRPREGKGHFYVEGAAEHKRYMKSKLAEYEVIHTATEFMVMSFHPIPRSAMNPNEIVLAQLGYIRPMNDPDWDNIGKTYSDMVNELLIMNDNNIICGQVIKFYSIKPRIVIYIRYQDGYDSDFNKRRITKSTLYNSLIKKGVKKTK